MSEYKVVKSDDNTIVLDEDGNKILAQAIILPRWMGGYIHHLLQERIEQFEKEGKMSDLAKETQQWLFKQGIKG